MTESIELSIVMPCLNEVETLAICIRKARLGLESAGVRGEIIIADNGSSDGSQQAARDLGARVVDVDRKGYGNALRGGIEAARGMYVVMGDADDSYDFSAIVPFVAKLRQGFDLVMGNRFLGGIDPGAMPWKHRWVGNPILSAIGRLFFHSPAGDFHCGLRGFRKDCYERLNLRTTGMEFASEMVVRASLMEMKIAEVPIRLHRDGRSRPPHLRSWRDGWRHLRFMLLYSPRWLFLVPGAVLFVANVLVAAWLLPGARQVGSAVLDIHTLLVATFLAIAGYQVVAFALFTKMFAITEGFHGSHTHLTRVPRFVNLETGVVAGLLLIAAGAAWLVTAVLGWRSVGYGQLDPRVTMRQVIPAGALLTFGVQTIFTSFFLSILGLKRK
jgi:glycosyltransferase involved in cell wall biosynthesis